MRLLNKKQEKFYCKICKQELPNKIGVECNNCDAHFCVACDLLRPCDFCNNRVCVRCIFYREKKMSCKHCCKIAMIQKRKDEIILGKCVHCLKSSLEIYISKCDDCSKNICMDCMQHHDCQKKHSGLKIQKMFAEKIMVAPKLKEEYCYDFCWKKVVITGKLKSMKRKKAEWLIITSGGDVMSTVSRNTDFVIVGDNPGSKLDRAQELGIRILTEEEFLAMVDQPTKMKMAIGLAKGKEPTKKRRIIL